MDYPVDLSRELGLRIAPGTDETEITKLSPADGFDQQLTLRTINAKDELLNFP